MGNKSKPYRLLVVAHPDDETIFFGGLVLSQRSLPWHLICVTDGNADGRGAERNRELAAAAKTLGIASFEHWKFPDIYSDRLSLEKLQEQLSKLPLPKEVYTHGPLGEYGHPHHQDISLAVHRVFGKTKNVWSPAWNALPEKVIKLTASQYAKKGRILSQIYGKETMRFLNIIPHQGIETFRKVTLKEVEAMVGYFRKERELTKLDAYTWMQTQVADFRENLEKRLF